MASALRICYSTTCAAHWIAADKSKTKEADREFIKYVFFHALHNAGVSAQYMNTARAGLSKALNTAAHWAPRIVNQVDVHGTGILYKFDIRDFWGYSLIDTSASDFTLFPGLSDDDLAFAPKKVDLNGNVVEYASEAGQSKMRVSLIFPLVCGVALSALAADRTFTSYASVKPVLDQPSDLLPAELRNPNEAKWRAWSQREDKAIRARLRQGDLDSMVNLLLYGTSFTKQPRIKVEGLAEASKAGTLRARVDDLVAGLRSPGDNERLTFLNRLLRSQGIDPEAPAETGMFIYNNLLRVIQEMQTLSKRGEEAKRLIQPDGAQPDGAPDPAAIFNWRPGLLRDRGVSLDTSIFPNFSIEQALRDLKNRGVLREGQVARVAVIGPGLDFSDKNEAFSYDYYPQQTLQPFALYDSLLRLGLATANAVSMSIFDISTRVIDHVQRARGRARINTGYVIQLPRELANPWPSDLIAYWRALGDRVGAEVAPIRPPEILRPINGGQSINSGQGLETRAVQIRPDVVLNCQPVDLNIVLERLNLAEADRFDLMVGTNIFIYYGAFERSLALENAGAMLKHGGLLLTNDRLPEVPGGSMRQAGLTDVQYNHDAVGWYRRQ